MKEKCFCPIADTAATEVSVKELTDQDRFTIYPNPSAGIVTIKCNTTHEKPLSIRVADLLGKEILNENYKEEINLSHLEKGIYCLSLYQNGALVSTKKVMKD